MRFSYPYEITKLYKVKDKEPDQLDTEVNYAFAVQENFDTIRKYLNEIVGSDNIVSNAITASELADGCITASKLADGCITPSKLDSIVSKYTLHFNPRDAILPVSNAPALVQIEGTNHSYELLDFDATTDEACFWHFSMPENKTTGLYSVAVTIKYIADATSGDVVWALGWYSCYDSTSIDPALDIATFSAHTVDATANDLNVYSNSWNPLNMDADEWVILKLYRDADSSADTLVVDARVLEVLIQYYI